MKTMNFSFLAVIGLSLFLMACGGAEQNREEETTEKTEVVEETSTVDGQHREAPANGTEAVLDAYLIIKDGLVASDAEQAAEGAEQMLTVLRDMDKNATLQAIQDDARHIAASDEVSHQRDHFNTLSNNLMAVVKNADEVEEKLYRQFCPMAFDNTGAYWLSTTEEIRNPYFGDKMLKCGKVVETIN